MAKLTRILSIDGGGIRGIIPGQVLLSLERKLKEREGNQDARIADFFDLVAGTSTGGILTCVYLCPDFNGNPTRPRFSAEEAVDLYLKRGQQIFDASLSQRIRALGGLLDERYSARELEKALKNYFGELRLSELLKPCLVTAYDIKRRRAKFFNQLDAKEKKMHDYLVRDIARATSAEPTFFEAKMMKSLTNVPYPVIGGGIFANNPTLCAYAEARQKFDSKPTAIDMAILSIGTGYIKKQYSYRKAKDWGALSWIRPIMDILMSAVSETVDYQVSQVFDSVGRSEQYLRVNHDLLYASPDMDDTSTENLAALQQDGTSIAEKFDSQLDSFADLLVAAR
ncbi:MAG: patatin-like phospholipase family protein [Dehalococcoidia bacterium]|nr:patatin-like phospholipase family protein [Dehalococcoidia bacterium]